MTPTLLLDMDGPLADFDLAFWELCQRTKIEMNIESLDDPGRKRFLTDNIVHDKDRRWARNHVDTTPWFEYLPVVAGAKEGVQALLARNVDIWVCTKPLEKNPWCRDDKGRWLRRHFPMLEDKLIIAPDKSLVRGTALLDDAIKPEWIDRAVWAPIVFSAPYNGEDSQWDGLPRWCWGDPIAVLLDLLGVE